MEQTLVVLQAALPIYLVMMVGGLLRRFKVLRVEMDQGLMTLAVHVLLPALVLDNVVGNRALLDFGNVATAAGLGFGVILLSLVVAYGGGALLGLKRGEGRRTFAVTAGMQNYGYMAIPLLAALFPDDGALGVMLTHNVGVELAMWTVVVAMLSGDMRLGWRVLWKGPVVAVCVGLAMNALGGEVLLDGVPRATLGMLGQCAIPLALLLVGATFSDLLFKERFTWRTSLGACALRLGILPLMMLGISMLLPLDLPMRQVMVIQAAMPCAVFPVMLARYYGGRPEVAVEVVVATNLLCLVTMPFVVALGVSWLGV